MLCSILFSIVYKEIGKQVHFRHNKDHFCRCFRILTTSFAKNGYFSENKKPLYSAKLNHLHRKYSRKKFYRRMDIPEVSGWLPPLIRPSELLVSPPWYMYNVSSGLWLYIMHYHLMHYWNVNCILNKVWAAFTSNQAFSLRHQFHFPSPTRRRQQCQAMFSAFKRSVPQVSILWVKTCRYSGNLLVTPILLVIDNLHRLQ